MTELPIIQQLSDFTLNLLYPPKCVACKDTSSNFCAQCRTKINYIKYPLCPTCGYPKSHQSEPCRQCNHNPLSHLTAIRSAALFEDDPLKLAIHKLKYKNLHSLASELAKLLEACLLQHPLPIDVIVPVPLHPSRHKERGYNQATVLAKSLSRLIKKPVDDKTLKRRKKTRSQMTLKAADRQENVANAFVCLSNRLEDKNILLIDDVCTTGATLDACAQALKFARAGNIYGLTLARAK